MAIEDTDQSGSDKGPDVGKEAHVDGSQNSGEVDVESSPAQPASLVKGLQGRHMQMIAIGGSIGAGLFVGSGGALQRGGPASVLIGWGIIGVFILCTVQAMCELSVVFPVNGSFYQHSVRLISPSWGFANGWIYAGNWLVTLPFEIIAAGITISYWHEYHISIWVVVFMTLLVLIQFWGVKGYGEVEFALGVMKVVAVLGFIIFGIIVNTGGVPGDDRGYIGFRFWNGEDGNHAFRHGFKGFASVFTTASFSFGGTELVGLAVAEAKDPKKSLPKATRQVFARIAGFYIISLFIVGLIVPNGSEDLLGSSGANTKASPFVLAIKYAGVSGLPSVFNAVIMLSVLSVANSCTYGSTRTLQALSLNGMGPKKLGYVDKKGRPMVAVVIQLLFGCLAFVGEANNQDEVFTWLLSLCGLSYFFTWGSICFSHVRFRMAWKQRGRTLDDIPFKSDFGLIGSIIGTTLAVLCLIAIFYVSLLPIGSGPDAEAFFQTYLCAPLFLAFWFFWMVWTHDYTLLTPLDQIDLDGGRREYLPTEGAKPVGELSWWKRTMRSIF